MAMIQGIDGGMLLNALRAGRQDRMNYDEHQAKIEAQKSAQERQNRISGLMGQLFDNGQGLEAQVVPTQQGFGAAGEAAPQAPQAPMTQPRRPNPQVMAQLIALDPETGGRIVSAFKTMDETNLQMTEAKNTIMGAAAQKLMTVPEAERPQVLRMIAPQLMEAGWSEQEIAQANLSDQGLQMLQATAIDLDALIDNELAERQFNAGKVTPVQENGMLIRTMPDGTSEVIAAPAGYQGGQGGGTAGLPTVSTPDEARRLPPGTQFRLPDGRIGTVPGGGGGNVTGNFPGGAR